MMAGDSSAPWARPLTSPWLAQLGDGILHGSFHVELPACGGRGHGLVVPENIKNPGLQLIGRLLRHIDPAFVEGEEQDCAGLPEDTGHEVAD